MKNIIKYRILAFVLSIIPETMIARLAYNKAAKIADKAIASVSGYRDFLNKRNIPLDTSFENLPVLIKKEYINNYSIDQLTRSSIYKMYSIESSSGYSGKGYYWPRYKGQDSKVIEYMEHGFNSQLKIDEKTTLFINAFTLGLWVTGEKLSRMLKIIASKKKYNLTVATVGCDYEQTIDVFERFYSYYDQIVIAAYPPFLKNLLEMMKDIKIEKPITIHLIAGGEGFSEEWRMYITTLIKGLNCIPGRIISAYGAAEINLNVGYETDATIALRKLLAQNRGDISKITGISSSVVPSIFQYNPLDVYIECINNNLVFTVDSGIPLVRYNVQDVGAIAYPSAITKYLKSKGELLSEYEEYMNLPFLFVFGRSDGSISVNGTNVYIDLLHEIMNNEELVHLHTGNYFIQRLEPEEKNKSHILIEVELKEQADKNSIEEFLQKKILEYYIEKDIEFAREYKSFPEMMTPVIRIKDNNGKKEIGTIKNKYKR